MKPTISRRWRLLAAASFLSVAAALAEPGAALTASDTNTATQSAAEPGANIGPEGVLQVDGVAVTKPILLRDVRPHYPEIARHWRLKGPIVIEAVVDRDGNVRNARAAKDADHPAVVAAIKAVSQRKYKPATRDGVPVAVSMVVTINVGLQ